MDGNVFGGDIPKTIRYDFLITFLGIFLLASGWYFGVVQKVDSDSILLMYVVGAVVLYWGLYEMSYYYNQEKSIKQLQTIIKKKELFDKLKNTLYLIDEREHKFLINTLLKEVKDIIKEKKESQNDNSNNKSNVDRSVVKKEEKNKEASTQSTQPNQP